MQEPDDNTLDNARQVGRDLADTMSEKLQEAITQFPHSDRKQRVAIARIVARNMESWADEEER